MNQSLVHPCAPLSQVCFIVSVKIVLWEWIYFMFTFSFCFQLTFILYKKLLWFGSPLWVWHSVKSKAKYNQNLLLQAFRQQKESLLKKSINTWSSWMHSCNAKASEEGESLLAAFLLEYLEGDGGVLDGDDHPAVVQVKDVMLLLKNLSKEATQNGQGCHFQSGEKFCRESKWRWKNSSRATDWSGAAWG